LLDALFDPTAPQWLRQAPSVAILRKVWVQNDQRINDVVRWRTSLGYSSTLSLHWLSLCVMWLTPARSGAPPGWETSVHLTESCEDHLPLLIPHVETTSAPVSDDAMTATIHAELDRK
jgi:transposase